MNIIKLARHFGVQPGLFLQMPPARKAAAA
jgi:hypothetical protein